MIVLFKEEGRIRSEECLEARNRNQTEKEEQRQPTKKEEKEGGKNREETTFHGLTTG